LFELTGGGLLARPLRTRFLLHTCLIQSWHRGAVADLVLQTLTPLTIDVALSVTDQITAQAADADSIRASHVQRAHHNAELARRRYLSVDPTNRLVADALEAHWNTKLRELADAQDCPASRTWLKILRLKVGSL